MGSLGDTHTVQLITLHVLYFISPSNKTSRKKRVCKISTIYYIVMLVLKLEIVKDILKMKTSLKGTVHLFGELQGKLKFYEMKKGQRSRKYLDIHIIIFPLVMTYKSFCCVQNE